MSRVRHARSPTHEAQQAGIATAEVYRRHGISPATFFKLKSEFGGLEVSEAMLYIAVLKGITGKKR